MNSSIMLLFVVQSSMRNVEKLFDKKSQIFEMAIICLWFKIWNNKFWLIITWVHFLFEWIYYDYLWICNHKDTFSAFIFTLWFMCLQFIGAVFVNCKHVNHVNIEFFFWNGYIFLDSFVCTFSKIFDLLSVIIIIIIIIVHRKNKYDEYMLYVTKDFDLFSNKLYHLYFSAILKSKLNHVHMATWNVFLFLMDIFVKSPIFFSNQFNFFS